jgi:anti-sigma factor RsiW
MSYATSPCGRAEALRDYAFEESGADERQEMERHLATCGECALELDRLRVTTAALRTLPDREIPQRIAFVSDRVFAPSRWRAGFGNFWNSAAQLGFASACVLAAALVITAWHRPVEVRTVIQATGQQVNSQDIDKEITRQVNDSVAKAIAQVRVEDAQTMRAALKSVERKYEGEHRDLMVAMGEDLKVLQARLNTWTIASNMPPRGSEAGQ